MKKVILVLCLAFGVSQFTNAQFDYGVKAGVNYNSNSIQVQDVSQDVLDGAKSKTGYHFGVWTRFKIPIVGFYLRPELVYTNLVNEQSVFNVTTKYSFRKLDIPVLLGKKFLGVGNAFIGPSFQYIIGSKFDDLEDFSEVDASGFTVGVQMGVGVELGKLGIDLRWERGFSDVESSFIGNHTRFTEFEYDTRINQIIVGLSLKL